MMKVKRRGCYGTTEQLYSDMGLICVGQCKLEGIPLSGSSLGEAVGV